jgi:hypothetical protein
MQFKLGTTESQELIRRYVKSQTFTSWRRSLQSPFFPPSGSGSIKLRSDKQIFFSPISYTVLSKNPPVDYSALIEEAKHEIDIIDPERTIHVELDGHPQSGWFRGNSGGFFNHLGDNMYIDGYWMLFPIPKGAHFISSMGSCRSGQIRITKEYEINAK